MSRKYKCLDREEFTLRSHRLICIRDEDKYAIMEWRNEQIDVLRQKEPLTKESQEKYFATVVDKLFETERPDQLLFSFLENDRLIGYGGLVHIDWSSKNGEISFITETKRNASPEQFKSDWSAYLALLKVMVQSQLGFTKIYTYAYDIRPHLFTMLDENHFTEEARLKKHISIRNAQHDVLIHSYFFDDLTMRRAAASDARLYFDWANDETVRQNSFNQSRIEWDTHKDWFLKKLGSSGSVLFVACLNEQPVGQIRFDEVTSGQFEIDFSIAKAYRGRGLGNKIISLGTKELLNQHTVNRVVGKVKSKNIASIRSFGLAGFTIANDDPKAEVVTCFIDNPGQV